jgi:hypothetical protein
MYTLINKITFQFFNHKLIKYEQFDGIEDFIKLKPCPVYKHCITDVDTNKDLCNVYDDDTYVELDNDKDIL